MKIAFISRGHFFQTIILSTNNPMLSSKLNVLFHNSIPSCQMKNTFMSSHFFQVLVNPIFSRLSSFWAFIPVQTTLCYLQNWMFCPITLFQVVRFEKSLHKQGLLFCRNCFEYQQSYVIFKIEHFMSYFITLFISICICSMST